MENKSSSAKLSLQEARRIKQEKELAQKNKAREMQKPKTKSVMQQPVKQQPIVQQPVINSQDYGFPSPHMYTQPVANELVHKKIAEPENDNTMNIVSAVLASIGKESSKANSSQKIINESEQPTKIDCSRFKEGTKYKLAYVPEDILDVLREIIEAPIDSFLELGGRRYGVIDLDRTIGDDKKDE